MQGFYWNVHPGDSAAATTKGVWWDTLAAVAPELSGAGFSAVWTPSPAKGMSGVQSMGYDPYDYYDLGDLNQKGSVRTRFGTRAELEAGLTALQGQGVGVMTDLVLGHRAGADFVSANNSYRQAYDCQDAALPDSGYTFFSPASGRFPGDSTHFHPNSHQGPYPLGHCNLNPPYHDAVFFEDVCYFHGEDTVPPPPGWFFGPHILGHVGDSLIAWGRWLMNDIGFDGVRLDAVKHIEPGFMGPFLVELVNGIQPFAVGEFFDSNMGLVKSWHDQVEVFNTSSTGTKDANLAMFDFNLRYALRDMCNNTGGGYDMWNLNSRGLRFHAEPMDPEDIVTFVENHDVDRIGLIYANPGDPGAEAVGGSFIKRHTDGGHDPVVFDKHMAYAYIMAAEGRPMVFWKDYWPTWYNLKPDIDWLMALRAATAAGPSRPVSALNPSFGSGWHGGDVHVLSRAGAAGVPGALLVLNDRASGSGAGDVWVDTPFLSIELKDYSDAFMFETSEVFGDGRANVKADSRTYAWYAPTGLYPQLPGTPASSFVLDAEPGGKLHFVVLRSADAANFLIDGSPIGIGDEVAISGPPGTGMAGIGRIGQSVRWDGVHDMIIEVLGNATPSPTSALSNVGDRLDPGDALVLMVKDQSTGGTYEAGSVTWAASASAFTFAPERPASRGPASFDLTTTDDGGTYVPGGISQVTGFSAGVGLPVVFIALDARVSGNDVTLKWQTAREIENAGFAIEGQRPEVKGQRWEQMALVEGSGTTKQTREYSYTVDDLAPGRWVFRLKQLDFDGSFTYSQTVELTIDLPDRLDVVSVYPNPLNPSTTIRFSAATTDHVRLVLYDAMGRPVKTLFDGYPDERGVIEVHLTAHSLPAGVYFVRLEAGNRHISKAITVLK
jgi:alpha-amylase